MSDSTLNFLPRAANLAISLQENAASIDFEGGFPTQEFSWFFEAGLLRSEIIRLPATEILQILWHIGRGNLAVGRLYEGHLNALQLIDWFASPAQKNRYFAEADAGKLFAVWNTQAANGVTFEPDSHPDCDISNPPDVWQMRGAKTFCSGAGHVARPIVTGERAAHHQQPGGWQMVVIPTENARLAIDKSWWQPLGMRASSSFQTDFSGTRLQDEDFLGTVGDYYRQPAFSGGAIRFCAVQLGGAAAIFEATRRFLGDTERGDDVFQQTRIGQMTASVQSGWQWIQNAGEMWESLGASPQKCDENAARQMVAFAAMMRVATEEIAVSTLQKAEKCVGARGLLRPQPFERLIRDLTLYLKQPHLDEIPCRVGRYALQSAKRADELWQPDPRS